MDCGPGVQLAAGGGLLYSGFCFESSGLLIQAVWEW